MHERNRALWDTLRERFDSPKPAVQYEQIAVAPNERLSVSPTADGCGVGVILSGFGHSGCAARLRCAQGPACTFLNRFANETARKLGTLSEPPLPTLQVY
jgi:hypothetical protein